MTNCDLAAGQVLLVGTYGTELSPAMRRRLEKGRAAGLILMGRNVESPPQVRQLLDAAAAATPAGDPPPLLGVDQEGGRVARLGAPVLRLPPARRLGELADVELTRRATSLLGRQLRALGFTVDFAPVLDVDGGAPRTVIGDRSFGGDARTVAAHGSAAVAAFLEAGICPCGKHFPGHGVTTHDSHIGLPRSRRQRADLKARELPPFTAAFAAGLPLLMPAHIIFEALDPERPATFSPAVLGALLRDELGYRGAVITDDLDMGAVQEAGGAVDVALAALMAGADLLLMCHDEDRQEAIRAAVADAARRSSVVARRLEDAAGRVRALRQRFVPAARTVAEVEAELQCREARELAARLAEGGG